MLQIQFRGFADKNMRVFGFLEKTLVSEEDRTARTGKLHKERPKIQTKEMFPVRLTNTPGSATNVADVIITFKLYTKNREEIMPFEIIRKTRL